MSNIPMNRPIKPGYFLPSQDHLAILRAISKRRALLDVAYYEVVRASTHLSEFRFAKLVLDLKDHGLVTVTPTATGTDVLGLTCDGEERITDG